MKDEFNTERFYEVHRDYFDTALKEIQSGRKMSHWMWYIFPQHKNLGCSYNSLYYGMESTEEAKVFYEDDYLGDNLRKICRALLECESDDAFEVMDYPDNLKLWSSMTLFYIATGDELFKHILDKFFNGELDAVSVSFLT